MYERPAAGPGADRTTKTQLVRMAYTIWKTNTYAHQFLSFVDFSNRDVTVAVRYIEADKMTKYF